MAAPGTPVAPLLTARADDIRALRKLLLADGGAVDTPALRTICDDDLFLLHYLLSYPKLLLASSRRRLQRRV